MAACQERAGPHTTAPWPPRSTSGVQPPCRSPPILPQFGNMLPRKGLSNSGTGLHFCSDQGRVSHSNQSARVSPQPRSSRGPLPARGGVSLSVSLSMKGTVEQADLRVQEVRREPGEAHCTATWIECL